MNTSKYNGKYAKCPTPKSKQSRPKQSRCQDSLNPDQDQQSHDKQSYRKQEQEQEQQKKNRNNELEINDGTPPYRISQSDVFLKAGAGEFASSKVGRGKIDADNVKCTQPEVEGLSTRQQQFVLKFCSQLASVIEACEQSESAEIEVGRRQINKKQIKVKLQAERELTVDSNSKSNRRH